MPAQLDPAAYLRVPKLDVGSALGLAKILLHHVPRRASPGVRKAASAITQAVAELEAKWTQQFVPRKRIDKRPLARRLEVVWSSVCDRLTAYAALPDGNPDRAHAIALHDLLFPDGLAFLRLTFVRVHAHSERRIELIDERGLANDLARLIGEAFLAALRDTHQAFGHALGITKAAPLSVPVVLVAEPLHTLVDAIRCYTLQLLALAFEDPETREAVGIALAPIDAFRATARRRTAATDHGEEEDEDHHREDDDAKLLPIAPLQLLPTGSD